jgi:hypothetical protein
VIDAVKNVLGAPVPELAMIEDRVDRRWSVARLDPAGVSRADEKAQRIVLVTRMMNALRRHGVIAVGGRIESAANTWIGEPGQREDRGFQLRIRTMAGRKGEVRYGYVLQARAHLVLRSRIGPRAEMAARAGLHAVTPHLHVPEEGFA